MQEKGISNPSEQTKKFTNDLVEKLKALPLDEEIKLDGHSFYDSKGNLILKMPVEKTTDADKKTTHNKVKNGCRHGLVCRHGLYTSVMCH
jgi:hypothetical protein